VGDHGDDTIEATVERYVATREAIERKEKHWTDLAVFFTDDAVYIDPAWGRVQGIDQLLEFFDESMRGLDDWEFPIEFTAIDGDTVAVKWTQIVPTTDGRRFEQSGYSTLHYAGGGKFDYEEDLLNMAHVLEDLKAAGWRPGDGFVMPPASPDRDWSRPGP